MAQLAVGVSISVFHVYLRHGDLLLYGDAVAHINIARRVFDSRTPGLLQLGTVWLPLPHLLMVPFLLSNVLWQTGIGGSIPSMVAYVLGVSGVFRLVRDTLRLHSVNDASPKMAAWLGAGIYGANPNLLYLQSTAMTESLYLAFFIWAVVYFLHYTQTSDSKEHEPEIRSSALVKCGLCLIGACFTRYDGWFLSAVMCVALLIVLRAPRRSRQQSLGDFRNFVLVAAAAPVLWLGYNAVVYRNPLEFANGPYSAKAIEQKTATPGYPAHPGANDLPMAFSFFLKSAEMNVASVSTLQRLWVALFVLGAIATLIFDSSLWPLLLLGVPLPFYILSIAYGGLPIFLPVWWPHSYYNLRYGLQLLPAFAAFISLFAHFAIGLVQNQSRKALAGFTIVALVAGSYISVWREQPICFREAWINSRDRITLETALAENLRKLPPNSTLLMYVGTHVGAIQNAGISFSRVINEGNHRPWKKPSDTDGLWERALANPKQYVDYVVASDNDEVSERVQKSDLSYMVVIRAEGEQQTTIYWTHRGVQ